MKASSFRGDVIKEGNVKSWSLLIGLSAILIVSGFFISHVLAAHIANISVDPLFVTGGSANPYTFTIENEGEDSIYKVVITAPDGFTINDNPTCPTGWTASHTGVSAECLTDPFEADVLVAGNNMPISFSATGPSPAVDTLYEWDILTKDVNVGYELNTSIQMTVDVTAPETTDDAVTDWGSIDVPVTLTPDDGIGSGIADTKYCIYNSGDSACTPDTLGTSIDVVCDEGSVCEKIVRYYSIDNLGLTETAHDSDIIQIDKQEPVTTINITGPQYGDDPIYIKSTTEFTLNAIDSGSGVVLTEYQIDEEAVVPYEGIFTVSDTGSHTIAYWSTDDVGNTEVAKTLDVYVDDTPPEVGLILITPSHSNGTTYISGLSNISAEVVDPASSGINEASCYYTLDGSMTWTLADYSMGSCVIEANTSGATIINMKVSDNIGNEGEGTPVDVTPDITVPIITVDGAPASWTNQTTGATIECVDGESGCDTDTIAYRLYPTDPGTCPMDGYTIGSLANITSHTWVCGYAEDNVGNPAVSLPVEFTVDQIDPVGSLGEVPDIWQNTDATITLNCSDDGGSGCNLDEDYYGVAETEGSCVIDTSYSDPILIDSHSWFCWKVTDNAGNENTGSSEIKVDKIKPDSEITGPVASSWQKEDFALSVSDSDTGGSELDICSYRVYSDLDDSGTFEDPGEITLDWTTRTCNSDVIITVGEGQDCQAQGTDSCKIQVKAIDVAGNDNWITPWENRIFSIDWTVPTTTATPSIAPDGNDDWYVTAPSITLECTDTGESGCDTTYYKWDDSDYTSYLEAIIVPEGTHTLYYYSVDTAGNVENEVSQEFKVDLTDPLVNAGDDVITNIEFLQNTTASDNESGIAAYGWTQESGPGSITFGSSDAEDTTISANTDGMYIIRLTITDTAGRNNYDEMTLIWDTQSPTITDFNAPEDNIVYKEGVPLQFTPGDTGTAVICSYSVDGGGPVEISCTTGVAVDAVISDLGDGRHSLYITVIDEATNSVDSDTVSFVIDLNNTLTVGLGGEDFGTIQEAVDAASEGDTINVSAGVYVENITIPNDKVISIVGAGKELTHLSVGTGTGFSISGIGCANIKGFDIYGAGRGSGYALFFEEGAGGTSENKCTFENNKVHDMNYGTKTNDRTPTPQYWSFKNNEFYEIRIPLLLEGTSYVDIIGNTMRDFKEGIEMNYDGTNHDWIIQGNTFLEGNDYPEDSKAAIILSSAAYNIDISGNTISDSPVGILVPDNATSPDWTNVNVYNNSIIDNGMAIDNQETTVMSLSAEANWWGNITGPYHVVDNPNGLGNEVSDNIDYRPWCTESTCSVIDYETPYITLKSPADNAVGVKPDSNITVKFSELVNIAASNVELDGVVVDVTFDEETNTATIDPQTDLESNTTYTITLTNVYDQSGNIMDPVSWDFTISATYSVELYEGWNLISLPVIPTDENNEAIISIETILEGADGINAVWTYDADADEWYVYRPSGESNLYTMAPGYAYWIDYAGGGDAIDGSGNLFLTGNVTPPSRVLNSGWNLIGYYQRANTDEIPASLALENNLNDYWTLLMGFDNETKFFTSFSGSDEMNPGTGYWVLLDGDTSATYIYAPGELEI